MPNLSQLATSIAGFNTAAKDRIVDIPVKTNNELSALMATVAQELDQQVIEMGIPNGGTFDVAITELSEVMSGNAINANHANHFTKTLTANTALSLVTSASGDDANVFVLHLVNGAAFTVTWWPGIVWAGGNAPTLTPNGRDVFSFSTINGGVTWDGYVVGKDLK